MVVYLGMRVNSLRGLKTLARFGPQINAAVEKKPEGLLLHDVFMWSLLPVHVGIRQYWRDFESLEAWSRSLPHQGWRQTFLRDPGGTGFWHETYFMRGGMEAIYDEMPAFGLGKFAPTHVAKGPMFSARQRAGLSGEAPIKPAVDEKDL